MSRRIKYGRFALPRAAVGAASGKFLDRNISLIMLIINKIKRINIKVKCSGKIDCAMHKNVLQCNKGYGKIYLTSHRLMREKFQRSGCVIDVSSTLLLWSGFNAIWSRLRFFSTFPMMLSNSPDSMYQEIPIMKSAAARLTRRRNDP